MSTDDELRTPEDDELDALMDRARCSILKTLDEQVDVQAKLDETLRQAGLERPVV